MKFVSKELAIKLKEKGFKKPCFGWYYIETPTGMNEGELIFNTSKTRGVAYKDLLCSHNANFIEYIDNYIDAPTINQVLKWLREEKYINLIICPYTYTAGVYYNLNSIYKINPNIKFEIKEYSVNIPYETYEDACIAGVEYVINNLI